MHDDSYPFDNRRGQEEILRWDLIVIRNKLADLQKSLSECADYFPHRQELAQLIAQMNALLPDEGAQSKSSG